MAEQEPVKVPRVSPWKVVGVLLVLLSLTPVWIAYGCLGAVLTLPSRKVTKAGLQLLVTLGFWITFHVFFADADEGANDMWIKIPLAGWLVVLVLAQWKLDQLMVFHLSQKPEERRINIAGIALLTVLVVAAAIMWKPSVAVLSDRGMLSSSSMSTKLDTAQALHVPVSYEVSS
ncbi:unnamed protein product [Phytophthora fragariaefolia]|uniref:Unnamed protein product n=1 Tax=Phytophthora fragariaefolia TaxID=1490495 RepID=A0A9W7CLI7_9STRA|nr:unnamed protein product [Phytophthora fragariaefolia]